MMSETPITRVAILNSARRWIGEAAHVLDLALGLKERGVEVDLCVRRGQPLEERARAAGLTVHSMQFESRFKPIGDFRDALALRRLVKRRDIQVVHCHRGKDHWSGAVALFGLRSRPALVRTRHVVTPMKNKMANRWLMHRATDGVIAVSEAAKGSLGGLADARVIYSAVDLEKFHPSKRSDAVRRDITEAKAGDFVIGLVGRIQRVKGQGHLLEAASMLIDKHPAIRVVVAGGERTPGRIDALRAATHELGIGQRVTFLDEVEDIQGLIASLDIGVIASVGSEGSSRVALETMASGVPLIATRVGVLPEWINHGENGLLCEPGDAAGLAKEIEHLVSDESLRRQLGQMGRKYVESHHTRERWLDEVMDSYSTAVWKRS